MTLWIKGRAWRARVFTIALAGLLLALLPAVARAAEEAIPDPLTVDVDLAVWSAVVFLVTLAVLWKFAWGPIVTGLERREKAIADNIAAAEEAAEEARRLTAQYEARLAGAAAEIRQLLDEGRRDAEHARQAILEEARAAALKERDRTLREIDSAKRGALKELADRTADLAVDLAGRIVEAKLTAEEHAKLVRQAVDGFSTAASSN